jgi:hypothetical protein
MSTKGLTLVEAAVILAVLLIVVALAVPGTTCDGRASNERNARSSLKTLFHAEMDFAKMDRDGNGVTDYWTGDVKGLYTMTSAEVQGATPGSTTDQSIKLIELSVACADADGTFLPAGGENLPLASFAEPSCKAGHWYAAMSSDRPVGAGPEAHYRQDTKGKPGMGPVHNLSRFAFAAIPDSSSAGRHVYIVNETQTIYRTVVTGSAKTGTATPPGLAGVSAACLHWPDDATLKSNWTKID